MGIVMKETIYPKKGENLSNWLARQTSPTSPEVGNSLNFWVAPPLICRSALGSISRSRPDKESDLRTSTTEETGFPKWSLLKRGDIRLGNIDERDANPTLRPTVTVDRGLRHILRGGDRSPTQRGALTPRSPRNPKSPPKRKKVSVPEVRMGLMTTVQEIPLDSPTIPGHHPMIPGFERSLSVPEAVLRRLSAERENLTPRVSKFPGLEDRRLPEGEPLLNRPEKLMRREPSIPFLKKLAPLVIPSKSGLEHDIDPSRTSTADEVLDTPPKVPPKSPATASRASPYSKQLPKSANSSASTICEAVSSAYSEATFDANCSPEPLRMPQRSDSLLGQQRTASAGDSMTPRMAWPTGNRVEYPSERMRHVSKCIERGASTASDSPASGKRLSWHQRGASEPSVIDRGRPMKRGDTSLIQSLSKLMLKSPSLENDHPDTLTSLEADGNTCIILEADEISSKKQADKKTEELKVLEIDEVRSLSNELQHLDERCEYLQSTHVSLRRGRRSLQTRIIAYLKSPKMAVFTSDSILKQEEAIAELDLSIDDWVMKLEQAGDRRTLIRQRLLEHVAAALTLSTAGYPTLPKDYDEKFPLISPPNLEQFYSSQRNDVQSIKVYADSGVTALLTEIEQEIGLMTEFPLPV